MNEFIQADNARRQVLCERTGERMRLPPASVEKDFWVCWTLWQLFGLPRRGQVLTFKGGTSLSKGWGLIERFSEDIDIVIDRHALGYIETGAPESGKQRRRRLEALKSEAQRVVRDEILLSLQERIQATLPPGNAAKIELDPGDPDLQSLLLTYPSIFAGYMSYIRPVVKIEMGARSDTEPAETVAIQPYVFSVLKAEGGEGFPVRAVAPHRTFWEKAMLLHEETYRPPGKPRKARLARHYYDLWCLITKGVAARAISSPGLFERVAAHRAIFFNWSWMDYSTLRPGALRLVPLDAQIQEWRRDYDSMRQEMFFGEVPTFDEILRVVGEFERQFNQRPSISSCLKERRGVDRITGFSR